MYLSAEPFSMRGERKDKTLPVLEIPMNGVILGCWSDSHISASSLTRFKVDGISKMYNLSANDGGERTLV